MHVDSMMRCREQELMTSNSSESSYPDTRLVLLCYIVSDIINLGRYLWFLSDMAEKIQNINVICFHFIFGHQGSQTSYDFHEQLLPHLLTLASCQTESITYRQCFSIDVKGSM